MKSIGIDLLKLFLTDEELARLELIGKENNPCRVALELRIPVDCN